MVLAKAVGEETLSFDGRQRDAVSTDGQKGGTNSDVNEIEIDKGRTPNWPGLLPGLVISMSMGPVPKLRWRA